MQMLAFIESIIRRDHTQYTCILWYILSISENRFNQGIHVAHCKTVYGSTVPAVYECMQIISLLRGFNFLMIIEISDNLPAKYCIWKSLKPTYGFPFAIAPNPTKMANATPDSTKACGKGATWPLPYVPGQRHRPEAGGQNLATRTPTSLFQATAT